MWRKKKVKGFLIHIFTPPELNRSFVMFEKTLKNLKNHVIIKKSRFINISFYLLDNIYKHKSITQLARLVSTIKS